MVTSRFRLPSRHDLLIGYAACALPIFAWSIYHVLREVPGWLLRLSTWDLAGVIAYAQMYALVESGIIFLLLILVAVILPERFFRRTFSASATTTVYVSSIWFILAHLNDETIRLWGLRHFLIGAGIYAMTIFFFIFLVHKFEVARKIIDHYAERLSVLSFIYIFFGFISLIIVMVRNI